MEMKALQIPHRNVASLDSSGSASEPLDVSEREGRLKRDPIFLRIYLFSKHIFACRVPSDRV